MAPRMQYDTGQAAKRLKVPVAVFRWGRHAGVVPAPDATAREWKHATVEAMDPQAIRASIPREPIYGGAAADRIAEAIGTPNQPGEKAAVGTFVVRRLIDLKLLTDLSGNADHELLNPDQVDEVCAHGDLAQLVAAHRPLGPDQAAVRLGVRRVDFDRIHKDLKWVEPAEWREVRFGTSRAGAVDVPLFRTADIDAIPEQHPEVDWAAVRTTERGRRSPLTALAKAAAAA